jgi:hypothetical protein
MAARFNKHFTLAEAAQPLPEGWRAAEALGWWIGLGEDLRLHPLRRSDGSPAGAALGWVLGPDGLLPDGAPLAGPETGEDLADWSAGLAGRFICLVGGQGRRPRVILDAGGLLGAVYDPVRRAVASIPDLLPGEAPRDEALAGSFGIPARRGWYPFGLTPVSGVSRLLPNFELPLDDFTPRRIWPLAPAAIPAREPGEAMPEIYAIAADIARRFCRTGKVAAHLTAGYDTRMVLAALGPEAARRIPVITVGLPGPNAALDMRVAARLAAQLGLRHEIRPHLPATAADIELWHARTGACIADTVSGMSRTLASWDPGEMQLTGACGEVGRAFYWMPSDIDGPVPDGDELLRRVRAPRTDRTREAAERWLETLPPMSAVRSWDFVYIEQRLGCWAGPAVYGSPQRVPSMSPFNSRRLFAAMLGLPDSYRSGSRFCRDFNQIGWPALNALPFNAPIGLDRLRFLRGQAKALLSKSTRQRLKRLLGR